MLRIFISFYLLFAALCTFPLYANNKYEVVQDFIQDTNEAKNRIEFFFIKPEGDGPFPVIFMLHGHQAAEKNLGGGKQLIDLGYPDFFVHQGIAVVSISIPGFGQSEGKQDLVGPDSQRAIKTVINHFKILDFIDASRMGIYGISKGAALASMVTPYCPDLMLQILESGRYDLLSIAPMPEYLKGIHDEILRICTTQEALIERSAVYHVNNVRAKTLILHGEFDDRKTLSSAKMLHEKLIEKGAESQIEIFADASHCLPWEKWGIIIPFVKKHFFGLYGIGISISIPMPAVQILKVFPGSPADLSGKLKVGDVILKISPNNDEKEINILDMPLKNLIPLITGEKGTFLRLHVQHFDLSYEDIVIERRY